MAVIPCRRLSIVFNVKEPMIGFKELLVLALLGMLVVAVVNGILSAKRKNQQSNQPSCGGCGYPTRGISELTCPECGADLRKVGIRMPGDGRSPLAGCLWPILFTAMVVLVSVLGYSLAGQIVPTHRESSMSMDLYPASAEYSEVLVEVEATLIIPRVNREPVPACRSQPRTDHRQSLPSLSAGWVPKQARTASLSK